MKVFAKFDWVSPTYRSLFFLFPFRKYPPSRSTSSLYDCHFFSFQFCAFPNVLMEDFASKITSALVHMGSVDLNVWIELAPNTAKTEESASCQVTSASASKDSTANYVIKGMTQNGPPIKTIGFIIRDRG